MFGLASILSAADQTIWLHRIAAHRTGMPYLRLLLKGDARRTAGSVVPKRRRMFTWQLPVMFLMCCTVTMIIGIWVLVWTAAAKAVGELVWDDDMKVRELFRVFGLSFGRALTHCEN
jgi:hypothetical protein